MLNGWPSGQDAQTAKDKAGRNKASFRSLGENPSGTSEFSEGVGRVNRVSGKKGVDPVRKEGDLELMNSLEESRR